VGSQKVIERISSITKSAKGQKECIQSENTNKRGFEMNDQITKDNFEQEMELEMKKAEYLNKILVAIEKSETKKEEE